MPTPLIVRDDGDGIRPDKIARLLLRYIASHIGSSHKPRERHEQILAGQCCRPSSGRTSDIRPAVGQMALSTP